ncbi:MAG: potassium transporter Kup [Acidobacteriota bacterium]
MRARADGRPGGIVKSTAANGSLDRRRLLGLSVTALGVVFGDIGTSPLYTIRVCFGPTYGLVPTNENVLGALSLVFWALVLVISVKYLVFVLQADNRGEGGILALMSLARASRAHGAAVGWLITAMGLFGAALLYGDGIITPAISVLSAVEGLEVATPMFRPYVITITIVLLVVLFLFQRRGTAGVGAVFGPVMLAWFATIGLLGLRGILGAPQVVAAVNPLHAVAFFVNNRVHGFLALGAVFLCVTGGEALYADMGHFGRQPIRRVWYWLVFPTLVLNYFGQGALLLTEPRAVANPFFHLAPDWAIYPLVGLSTLATIIASQAVISGSYSLTRQAVQLGFSPRLSIRHTSELEIGQIYVPSINWVLMAATIALVLGFRTSDSLAAAYGVAVTTTMVITTLLLFAASERWSSWQKWTVVGACAVFLVPDFSFFAANMVKVREGGWFPLAAAAAVFTLMSTWKRGRAILFHRLQEQSLQTDLFLADVAANPPPRVHGTAIYMTGNPHGVPVALLHNLKHNHVLHDRIVFMTVVTEEVPHVPARERLLVEELGNGFYRFTARYGFMETPDVPALIAAARVNGLDFDLMTTSFFLGRETLIPSPRPGMARWRERLFGVMSRNAQSATAFYNIPANRVVELGSQIEI